MTATVDIHGAPKRVLALASIPSVSEQTGWFLGQRIQPFRVDGTARSIDGTARSIVGTNVVVHTLGR